jgi:hydrogenase expression/formation protein HypE
MRAFGPPATVGKIASSAFARMIAPRLGAHHPEILVGPRHGIDVGVVDLGNDSVMAVTTDPLFIMPEYGWRRAAWFAIHIVASDAWTSGLVPRYCTIDLNLPPEMTDEDLDQMWTAIDETCRQIGLAVITGHTGRYDGCTFPIIGGATIFCLGSRDRYLTPAMARPGDAVVVTKGAAIETTGMFGATFHHQLALIVGGELAAAADRLFDRMSVVADARAAISIGVREAGVTAMHDATERGIWGGLVEIAEAASVGLVVDESAILLPPEVKAVCGLFGIDPYCASSEGTLLITCRPGKVGELIDRLSDEGIPATHVGEITPAESGVNVIRQGKTEPLPAPQEDPFWLAFRRALAAWGAS